MRSSMSLLLVGIFFGPLLLTCTRYPTIPEREVIQPPPASTRPAAPPPSVEAFSAPSAVEENYRIGPEDVLQVKVWDHEDLSRDVPVSQNGDFSYPLIGQVKASGRSVGEVEKEMTRRLADGYLVNPQVTVTVKEFRSQKVYIMGEINSPGTFPLRGPTSVVEIISRAGGPTQKAGTTVMVVRPRERQRREGPVSLEEAEAGEVISLDLQAIQEGNVSHNIRLQDGDTIIVPKAKYFFVFGEVRSPGKFMYEQGTTVLKAITIAGGITDKAAANRTRILRERKGERVEIPVRMSDQVQPNDIVMVPESFF